MCMVKLLPGGCTANKRFTQKKYILALPQTGFVGKQSHITYMQAHVSYMQ